jgi:orotidine-5'-phosphate decarboxylase
LNMNDDQNKLIIALDVDTADEALRLAGQLRGLAAMFKIGSQLFTAAGPALVKEIVASGERVFLDLKFHDIPHTVAAAGVEAARMGVSMFNVHAAGGTEMMRTVADAISEVASKENLVKPTVIGVTVLTSSNSETLEEIGLSGEPQDLVRRLALLAESSGLDGVVASPQEVLTVRAATRKSDFIIVTPGVRPEGVRPNDQKRVTTPRAAIMAGADYLVVGRPILQAKDPVQAARSILDEMQIAAAHQAS